VEIFWLYPQGLVIFKNLKISLLAPIYSPEINNFGTLKMAQKFNAGDVVQLKSGGPVMTVDGYENDAYIGLSEDQVVCKWFSKEVVQTSVFHHDTLALSK
jgi:uncharacterized protein YodC (DUF2158 family)